MQTMTPEVFADSRKKLIGILETSRQNGTDFDAGTKAVLTSVETALRENTFKIVLVGEFQGGKSTVFDILCDAREISPRGMGIATSAAQISACALRNPDEKETAELIWKSDEELWQVMVDFMQDVAITNPEIKAWLEERTAQNTPMTMADNECWKKADEALDYAWKEYDSFARDLKERREKLPVVTLVYHFCRTAEFRALRTKTRIGLEELGKYVTFPKDWDEHYGKRDEVLKYPLMACPFVFLRSATCYMHSEMLARLNATIIDAPGLGAGTLDREIAHEAMRNANAILYLLPGDKAIRETDLERVGAILQSGQEHKLFVAINAKEHRDTVKDKFRPKAFLKLAEKRLHLASQDVISVFHARLAFNAKWMEKNQGQQDNEKLEIIGEEMEEDMGVFLGLTISRFALEEKRKEIERKKDNYYATPHSLYAETGMDELFQRAEQFVMSNAATSLLFYDGVRPVKKALKKLQGDLLLLENAARADAHTVENEITAARAALEAFQAKAKALIEEKAADPSLVNTIRSDINEEVFSKSSYDVADSITDMIREYLSDYDNFKATLKILAPVLLGPLCAKVDVVKILKFLGCTEKASLILKKFSDEAIEKSKAELAQKLSGYIGESCSISVTLRMKGWYAKLTDKEGSWSSSRQVLDGAKNDITWALRDDSKCLLAAHHAYLKELEFENLEVDVTTCADDLKNASSLKVIQNNSVTSSIMQFSVNSSIAQATATIKTAFASMLIPPIVSSITLLIISMLVNWFAGAGTIGSIGITITAGTAGLPAFILGVIALLLSLVLGITVTAWAVNIIKKNLAKRIKEEMENKLRPALRTEIDNLFSNSETMKPAIQPLAEQILNTFKESLLGALQRQKEAFEQRATDALAASEGDSIENEKKAERFKKIREEQVEPVLCSLEDFLTASKEYLPQDLAIEASTATSGIVSPGKTITQESNWPLRKG